VEVLASLSQGRTAAAQCGLFTYKSVPVIFVPPCVYRVQKVFLRCPTPRLHRFLSSHWPSFRFLSFMTFFIHSIQFFFGLPRALFCFGIHFNAILGSLPSAILCNMAVTCEPVLFNPFYKFDVFLTVHNELTIY